MASTRASTLLQSFLQPSRFYSRQIARKHRLSRQEKMGPPPMVHPETTSEFASRDFDHSEQVSPETGYVKYYINKNPCSGELLGTAEKPKGYKTRKWRIDYYNRLMLEISSRHVSAYVNHNTGVVLVEASTKEKCISKHLYKTCDVIAAYQIGRILADRCQEMGLTRMIWEHKKDRYHRKVMSFLDGIHEGGIRLSEPKFRQRLPPPGTLP